MVPGRNAEDACKQKFVHQSGKRSQKDAAIDEFVRFHKNRVKGSTDGNNVLLFNDPVAKIAILVKRAKLDGQLLIYPLNNSSAEQSKCPILRQFK